VLTMRDTKDSSSSAFRPSRTRRRRRRARAVFLSPVFFPAKKFLLKILETAKIAGGESTGKTE
jgi:hypothetical protein